GAGLSEVLLGRPDFVENRRGETIARFGGGAQLLELGACGAPHVAQRKDSDQCRDDDADQQSCQAEQNAEPQRHGARSVTIRPLRTTPITTGFAGTSPFWSKAMRPVTPSNAGSLVPTRER